MTERPYHADARDALATAVKTAPSAPGVYVFLGAAGDVVYVGKAGRLRSRLYQHATADAPTSFLHGRYDRVRDVRWEVTPDEVAAAWREADLIFALRPPFNAETRPLPVDRHERGVPYVAVRNGSHAGSVRLTVERDGGTRATRHGCFPHLFNGTGTRIENACSDGYAALVRLLWGASGAGDRMPRAISRPAPDDVELVVDARHRRALTSFLSGSSARVIDDLAAGAAACRPPYMQPALRRDRDAALLFFAAGPRRVRDLRRRHGLAAGPVDADAYRTALIAELQSSIGPFASNRADVRA